MENFDLTKYLAEGKLHEALDPQDVVDIADTVAEEFTKESADKGDFMVYSVGELDSADMTFELDTDTTAQTPERILNMSNLGVGEGWGGNFRINSKEEGYEVRNAEKGGLVAIIDNMGNFKMLSADESRAEMGRTKGEETDYMQRRKETDDYMEEGKMLDEGMLDGIKDKIVAKVEKIKNKFSDQEIEKMKSAAEKALGKPAGEFTMADFTVDNIKKVGKAITALNEEDQIAEGLGEKIQGIGSGLGMTAMFVGGNMAMGSAAGGVEGFIAGAIAFVLSLIVGGIIKSRNNEAQEAPKSNKIPAEKLFALIARDLKFSPLAQDGAMLSKEEAIEIMRHVIAIEQSDISPEAALGEYIANGEFEEVKEIKSNKMKKSELKEMIKAAMMAETSVEETLVDADQDMAEAILNALGGEAAFEAVVRSMSTDDAQVYLGGIMRDHDIEMGSVDEVPGFEGTMDALDALSIREEEEDVEDVEIDTEEEVDVDVDMDMDSEPEGIDVKQDAKAELGGDVGDVQDNLEAALMAARELGDEKLEDQIGNTLTFFTRQHVVKENLNESTFPMWDKIK
jgi:hypothetical protein